MEAEIEKVLKQVRPMLALHRGDVEFVGYKDGIVRVKLLGTCDGCPLASLTLKAGIEDTLKEMVPEVKEVIQVV